MKNSKETLNISFNSCGAIILMTLASGELKPKSGALLTTIFYTLGNAEERDFYPMPGYRRGGIGLPNLGICCTLSPALVSKGVAVHELLVDTSQSMLGSLKSQEELLRESEDIGVSMADLKSLFLKLNLFRLTLESIEKLSETGFQTSLDPGLIADVHLDLRPGMPTLGEVPDNILHLMMPDICEYIKGNQLELPPTDTTG